MPKTNYLTYGFAALAAFVIFYCLFRWLKRIMSCRSYEGFTDTSKNLTTSTKTQESSLMYNNGDAVYLRTASGQSAADMPSSKSKYADIVDTFSSDTKGYQVYDLNLNDPKTYRQEVASSSQLALRGIRNPYYALNLSEVLMGNPILTYDNNTSRDGAAYTVQNVDVTPPIINVTDLGQGGLAGIAYS